MLDDVSKKLLRSSENAEVGIRRNVKMFYKLIKYYYS